MDYNTTLYETKNFNNALTEKILKEVAESLKEKGYDPIKQLVGYLMSGDSGYISSYQNARNKITSINRSDILAFLLKNYIGVEK